MFLSLFSPSSRLTHLLALAVGQVTLSQHEAAGADVHLTPRANQTHVLLHDDNNTGVCESGSPGGWRSGTSRRGEKPTCSCVY